MMQKSDDHMQKLEKIAPNVFKKIQCPLCMIPFDQIFHIPFILCAKNKHSVCSKCVEQLVKRYNQNTSQKKCPTCREIITPIPVADNGNIRTIRFQKDEQISELGKLMSSVNKMFVQQKQKVVFAERRLLQQRLKASKLQRQVNFQKYQITRLKNQNSILQSSVQLLKLSKNQKPQNLQMTQMFQKLQMPQKLQIEKPAMKRIHQIETDEQVQKYQQKINSANKKIIEDNKQLFDIDEEHIRDKKQITLSNKFVIYLHIQNLVKRDLSKLVELNLNFNRIGDKGLTIFCQHANAPVLKILKVANNGLRSIKKHIGNFKNLEHLDLGNFRNTVNSDENQNLFTNEDFQTLLQTQYPNMRFLSIQLAKENLWDKQQFLIKLMERLPQFTRIGISTEIHNMTKKKMGQITLNLNKLINSARPHPKMMVYQQA